MIVVDTNVIAYLMLPGDLTAAAEDLLAGNEANPESKAMLQLVAKSQCSAYDCEFVALAQQLKCALYTMDTKVLNAFPETAKSLRKPSIA